MQLQIKLNAISFLGTTIMQEWGKGGKRGQPTIYEPRPIGRYGNILAVMDPSNIHQYPDDDATFVAHLEERLQIWRADTSITAAFVNVHPLSPRLLPALVKVYIYIILYNIYYITCLLYS